MENNVYDQLLDNLIHFIECGWDLCVNETDANFIKNMMPYLIINKNNKYKDRPYQITLKNKNDIILEHQLLYWKDKANYLDEENNRIYRLIGNILND